MKNINTGKCLGTSGDSFSADSPTQHLPKKRTISSKELLGATGQLFIEHLGEQYCLRLTRQNKLILTK